MSGDSTPPSGDHTRTRNTSVDMLPAGTVLADRYRIDEVIGVGGMGMVYRAFDLQLETEVAIKLLRTDRRPDEETLTRFRREILLARKVSHPNVVRLHDIGRDGDLLFLTMDLVPGRTLREILSEGPLPVDQVAKLGQELAEALAVAHRQGVVHRDLKPGNILIDPDGRAHILDFGVARAMDAEQLTVAGEVVGTPAYLSPEQVRGEQVDHRSDLFTLGLILCEALCGRLPQGEGTLDELLGQRATGHTPDPSKLRADLPHWFARILRNCLAAKPEDRYHSGAELASDLATGQARSTTGRRRWRLAAVALAAMLAGFVGWWLWPTPIPPADGLAPQVHVAILPLANATGRETMDWAGRSLAQGLSESLAEAPRLQVTDSLRLFRLVQDLGVSAGAPDSSERRQLFELLDLNHLVSGRLDATDTGLRIELHLHEAGGREPYRVVTEAPSGAPLAVLPTLVEQLLEHLTGQRQELPLAPASDHIEALEYYDRGMAMLSRGQTVAAIEPLQKAVEADPDFAAAWTHLSGALASAGHYDGAVDSAEAAVALLSDHGGRLALEAQARLAELSGDPDRAQQILKTLIERFPGDTKARIQLAEVLIDLGELDAARDELSQIVETEPQHGQAWFLMGKAAIMAGDTARAAEDYLVRALVIENRTGSVQGRGDVVNALGIAHERMGNLDIAANYFSEAIELRKQAGDLRGTAATRANLAHLSLLRGDFEHARNELGQALAEREALGDQAGMASLYNQKGVIEEELGDFPAALAHYREALRLREALGHGRALADSYNNVAFAYYMLGQFDSARQFNRTALERLDAAGNPAGRIMALETRGYLELARGDWDEAVRAFLEALELSREINQPHSEAVARGGVGLVARQQGRFSAAFDALDQALELVTTLGDTRGQATYQLHLAELQLAAGMPELAASKLQAVGEQLTITRDAMLQSMHLRLLGVMAADTDADAAVGHLTEANAVAERSGMAARALQAEIALAGIRPPRDWDQLIDRTQRLGDAGLVLEVLGAAGQAALDNGQYERAAQLARRAQRPPVRIVPWSGNWRFHWLSAQADSGGQPNAEHAAMVQAREEIMRLLAAMPESWHEPFLAGLPAELADVEIEIN